MSTCPGFNMVFFLARADGRKRKLRLAFPIARTTHFRFWQTAPDVCDGTSAVRESRHRIPGASNLAYISRSARV